MDNIIVKTLEQSKNSKIVFDTKEFKKNIVFSVIEFKDEDIKIEPCKI